MCIRDRSSIIYCETAPGEYQELATLHGSENRIWVDLEDIPDYLVKALVAIEDHRFYEHKGVDWYRTVGAMYTMLTGGDSSFGGSTLTQQLIKTLTGNNEVTVQRKLIEIFQALEFEKKYDKDDILVWYLNAVYFGEGCDGIYTAAEKYFGKEPSELTLAESASIVGIVNLPTYYSPFYSEENNKKRQETVLRRMYELGYISYEEYEQAKNEELVFIRSEEGTGDEDIYSYYVEAVRKEVIADLMEQKGVSQETAAMLVSSGGYRIYACLDPYIQECIDNVYLDVENFPKPSNNTSQQFQSAIVIDVYKRQWRSFEMEEIRNNAPETEGKYLVEVKNLVKWFPIKSSFFKRTIGNVRAVDGISFHIKRGQTMGLVGESGCGKSTAGRTILRLIEKTSGEVLFDGQDIFKMSREELRRLRPRIQIIFQDPYSCLLYTSYVRSLRPDL